MEYALGPEVRSQDTKLLIATSSATTRPRDIAWEMLQERWSDVQKKTGEFGGNTVIVGALAAFCDAQQADEIKTFFAAHPVPDAERTLAQSLERINSCATFASRQSPKLAAWIKQRPGQ